MKVDDVRHHKTSTQKKPRSTHSGANAHKVTQEQFFKEICLLGDAAKKALRSNIVHG